MAALVVAVGVFLFLRTHAPPRPGARSDTPCAGGGGPEGCASAREAGAPPGAAAAVAALPVLHANQACRDVGYLCAGLDTASSIVIRHWKDFHGTMVVHVPAPTFEDPATASRLQDAAADGIRLWNGQPFPIVVEERRLRPAQIEVRWRRSLGAHRLGLANTVWSASTGLRVRSLELSTRDPFDTARILDPLRVTLTAAHEMGHALGLHHSDRPSDVMYPTNTSRALTARDYRTVEALYALKDGTRIVR